MEQFNKGLMQDFRLTIPTLLEHAATNHADTEVVARLQDGSVSRYTYADLAKRSRQAANALIRCGVAYGDVLYYDDLIAVESDQIDWPEFDERSASGLCYTSGMCVVDDCCRLST